MIGKPITILDRGTADGPLIEAPNLVYENGVYILFFSSNCYSTTLYDISYATSTTLKGPYKKSTAPLLVTGNFSLTAPGGASSNGHGHMVFQ
jgi:beta-xylosidase